MARIRTLKPEFWSDEKLAPMDALTRLVFLGLISQADDCGRILDSPKLINGLLFPYTDDDSTTCLRLLADASVICRGKTASGRPVIQIVGWDRHQRIEKPNMGAALPPIADTSATRRGSVGDTSATYHRPDLRSTINDQRPTISEDEDDPRASDGGDAFESWRLRVPATHRDAIHAALRAAQNPDALRREFLGLEHPITGGPSFGPEVVGQAVHEMAVAGTKMSAKTLRAFCRRVGEPERPNAKAEYDQWSPEALAKIGEAA